MLAGWKDGNMNEKGHCRDGSGLFHSRFAPPRSSGDTVSDGYYVPERTRLPVVTGKPPSQQVRSSLR